jgi:hypothetical protein
VNGAGDQGEAVPKDEKGDTAQQATDTETAAAAASASDTDDSESETTTDGDDASVVEEKVAAEEEPANPLDILVFPQQAVEKHIPQQAKAEDAENEDGEGDEDEDDISEVGALFLSVSRPHIFSFKKNIIRYRRKGKKPSSSEELLRSRPS